MADNKMRLALSRFSVVGAELIDERPRDPLPIYQPATEQFRRLARPPKRRRPPLPSSAVAHPDSSTTYSASFHDWPKTRLEACNRQLALLTRGISRLPIAFLEDDDLALASALCKKAAFSPLAAQKLSLSIASMESASLWAIAIAQETFARRHNWEVRSESALEALRFDSISAAMQTVESHASSSVVDAKRRVYVRVRVDDRRAARVRIGVLHELLVHEGDIGVRPSIIAGAPPLLIAKNR